jgi:hypothetical protein
MLALLFDRSAAPSTNVMNLRQVLEAGAAAAFAIANPDQEHFVETDEQGQLDACPKLTKKRYKWLDDNYKERSESLKKIKEQINVSSSHANIISAHNTFRIEESGERAGAPFFDVEDDYFVKTDLWHGLDRAHAGRFVLWCKPRERRNHFHS